MSTKRSKSQKRGPAQSEEPPPLAVQPRISFIIPALNEERYIGSSVGQFAQLEGSVPFEVIVADGGSTDKTVDIAKQLGAGVYTDTGRRKTIASGRNLGARFATGELLVFCDADTQIEDVARFTTRVLDVFRDSSVVGAVPRLAVFREERTWSDWLFSGLLNGCIRVLFFLRWPFAGGQCQVVRRTCFQAVRGYNRHQVHGEDSALFKKLVRIGRIRFLSDLTVFESPRRYRKFGYINLIRTGLYSILGQMIFKRNVLAKWERVD